MATMRTFDLALIGNDYNEEGTAIKKSIRSFAFPVNVGLDLPALQKAVQAVSASHRAYVYATMATIEGKKKVPNEALISRLNDAINECNKYEFTFETDDAKAGIELLVYVLDPMTHTTFLNGKRVMRLPSGAVDMLNSFTAYGAGTVKASDVKKALVTFSDGLNRIPYLKNRTVKITDAETSELLDMYSGRSQTRKYNRRGIEQKHVTRDKLVEQVILLELSKVFKFEQVEKEKEQVVTF